MALIAFFVVSMVGDIMLAKVVPNVLAGLATALLRVVLMPLPLIVVWLT